jgi:hypothetical protein
LDATRKCDSRQPSHPFLLVCLSIEITPLSPPAFLSVIWFTTQDEERGRIRSARPLHGSLRCEINHQHGVFCIYGFPGWYFCASRARGGCCTPQRPAPRVCLFSCNIHKPRSLCLDFRVRASARENFWRRSIIYGYRVFCVFAPLSSAAFETLTRESDFPAPKERHFCLRSDPIICLFPVCSRAERAHRHRHRARERERGA